MGGRRPLAVCLVAALVASVGAVALTASPASATTVQVGNEASYRAALTSLSGDNSGPHVIEITADFTITGDTDPVYSGSQPLTVDGNGHFLSGGVSRRVLFHSKTQLLTLDDLYLANGFAQAGGAVYAAGSVTVTDSTFSNNTATFASGGAIWASGSATVTNSTFSDNTATTEGGAISADSLTVIDSTFRFNHTTDPAGAGGAVSGVSVTVTRSTFANNTSQSSGGAIRAQESATAIDSTFTSNTATWSGGAVGGAIASYGSVGVTQSTFTGNSAATSNIAAITFGGAVYAAGTVTATKSTFTGNTATQGGALSVQFATTVTNSTITGNTAATWGGGIRAARSVRLVHTTLVGNTAANGANLTSGAGTESFGSVVAQPSGGGANCNVLNPMVSTYSYADDLSCGFDDATDDQAVGNDPQLLPLGDNGGPTLTRAPQVTSPLVDTIPPAACDPTVTMDQRGEARPADGDVNGTARCDIGAVELQPPAARPDARIKRGAAGALRGNNIFNTLTGQTVNGSAARGGSVTYYASVQNDASFSEPLRVRGQSSTTNFTVVYRNPAGANITGPVTSPSGYVTPILAPGVAHQIKIVVTVRNTAPRNASATRTLTTTSTVRPTIGDTVRLITSRS